MTIPTYQFNELGIQAQQMAKHCNNDRLSMIMQYVAVGSLIAMTGLTASKLLKELFGHEPEHHGRSR